MRNLTNFIFFHLKNNIKLQIGGIILTIMYSMAVILSPIASEYLINQVLTSKNVQNVQIGIVIFFIACILQPIIGFLKDIVFLNITLNISSSISHNMFNKVINAKVSFFDKIKKGEIISRINNDGNSISGFIGNFFVVYLKDILVILMILIGMFGMSIKITIVIIILLIVNLLINSRFDSKLKELSLEIVENNDRIYSYINQTMESITTIKAFGNENKVNLNYEAIVSKIVKDTKNRGVFSSFIRNLNNLIGILSLSIIYGLGSLEIINGRMTIGSVIALGLYFQLIINPLTEIINNNIELNSIKPIFERVDEYINLEQEFINSNTREFKNHEKLIISNLDFQYNNDFNILNKVNISFPTHGLIGIIGESGAGKSTLIKLLLNFYEPTSGDIKVGSTSYSLLGVNNIRKNIGFVDQNVTLFNMSIRDNIKYVNDSISDEKIIELCKQVNLHNKIMMFKNGYDTVINEKLNLSGGEKQRLGIAMALSKDPNILLLDEPTSSLDEFNELNVMNILKEISKEKLVIIVSHNQAALEFADSTHLISNN